MSCERHEADLALYVEGDLPVEQVPSLEGHLASCQACRAFLEGLGESQQMIRSLAVAPLPEEALHSVRRRVLARVSRKRPALPRWAFPVAASLALVALGLVALRFDRTPDAEAIADSRPPASAVSSPAPSAPGLVGVTPSASTVSLSPRPAKLRPQTRSLSAALRSTVPGEDAVSPDMDKDGLFTAERLSQDDADQLARAVVAIAAIDRVPHASEDDARPTATSRLIQIGTSDPNIVIYWELAPPGGES